MRKAKKDKRRSLLLSFCSFAVAVALTLLALMCLKEAMYAVMLGFAILSAVGYYFSVFRFFRYLDAKAAIDLLYVMNVGNTERKPMKLSDISSAMGWKNKSTRSFIEKCKKRGYIT